MARGPEPLDIAHETECTGARQFTAERIGSDFTLPGLAPDQRCIKVNVDFKTGAIVLAEFGPGATHFDTNRLDDPDVAAFDGMIDQPGRIKRFDEHRGATVHDRDFAAVKLDADIVNAERVKRGHQMLNRRYRAIGSLAQKCTKIRRANLRRHRANADNVAGRKQPVEDDAGIRICRMERYGNRLTGVDSDPGKRNGPRDRGLQAYYIATHICRRFPQYLARSEKTEVSPIVRSSPEPPQL